MAITESEVREAERRGDEERAAGYALGARYDRHRDRIVVKLNTGLELAFAPRVAEGLGEGTAEQLADIEISGSGFGLHWPQLDADLSVPGLLRGRLGSPRWMERLAQTAPARGKRAA